MAKIHRIHSLEDTKPRKSEFDLDFIINKCSANGREVNNDILEAFLLFANEIKEIKKHLRITDKNK